MLITDCIGLKVLSSKSILAGIGNELRHYFVDENAKTTTITLVLQLTDKIHGISAVPFGVNSYKIIVYGGKEFAMVNLIGNSMECVASCRINDWISSSNFYANDCGKELCLLTSHSIACCFSLDWTAARYNLGDKKSCPDKSTLYSSLICGSTWSESVFFSGTALGDLLVWGSGSDGETCIWHRLSGHNGVIFSIECNVEHGLITTTSDDRSVKMWQLSFPVAEQWSKCTVRPLRSFFGHTARVFRSKIISHDNQPYVISVGEDQNLCVWQTDGTLLGRKNLGAALWQIDCDQSGIAYASGSDGNVKQLNITTILTGQHCREQIVNVEMETASEHLSKIKYLKNGTIVALTNQNRLLYCAKNDLKWQIIGNNQTSRTKISLLETYENLFAVAGFKTATIYRYHDNTLDVALDLNGILERMVRSVKFVSSTNLLVCDDQGNCALCSVTNASSSRFFKLPKSKESWLTSALQLNDYLIMSDRSGNLHLFDMKNNKIELKQTLKQLHGNLGCTSLCWLPNGDIISAGHDGTIKTLLFDDTRSLLSVRSTEKVPVLWIDKVIPSLDIVGGFNDNRFVVWHRHRRELLAEIECGGGHRYWDIHIAANSCNFIYIRNKQLHRITFDVQKPNLLMLPVSNWHSKSCNVSSVFRIDFEHGMLLASGGDDNVLKISRLHNGKLSHIDDMTLHISSVKCLSVLRKESNRYLVFSGGGRAQICVTEVQTNGSIVILLQRTNFMLRLSDEDRKRQGTANVIDFDPETRFMSLAVLDVSNVVVGCSDGYVRHFCYENDKFSLLRAIYYGKCILHVHQMSENILLTIATDGLLCFWDWKHATNVDGPFHVIRHHKSGIQSFDVLEEEYDRWLLATGGDDQAVVISHFILKEMQIDVLSTSRLEHLHTAQVNGVRFSAKQQCLYTTGVDQTVLRVEIPTMKVERVGATCVADTKGILVLDEEAEEDSTGVTSIIVYGYGVQMLRRRLANK